MLLHPDEDDWDEPMEVGPLWLILALLTLVGAIIVGIVALASVSDGNDPNPQPMPGLSPSATHATHR
jgi:hypothetical protein